MNKQTIIIDIYGGPGSGKSSTAKILSGFLSANGYLIETPEEFPKYLVHKEDFKSLDNQIGIFREHKLRIDSTLGKYDFIISDSPTLMQLIYIKDKCSEEEFNDMKNLIEREHRKHKRISIFLNRKHKYQKTGRVHSKKESNQKSKDIKKLLEENNVEIFDFNTHELIGFEIFDFLNKKLKLINRKNKNKNLKKLFKLTKKLYKEEKKNNEKK